MFFIFATLLCLAGEETLTSDGNIRKTILRKGYGARPNNQQYVTMHYTGSLIDGTVFDSSRNRTALRFHIGNGVISGWSIGVSSMQVGELANFTIGSDYGYGDVGYPPIVPKKALLHFEIELLAIE
jgi:FKBP-type peptidyl-prolyl cis-trans isomerase